MRNHEEGKDLKSFSRCGRIDYSTKSLKARKDAVIGIKMWGKIDYLRKVHGWTFVWDNSASAKKHNSDVSFVEHKKRIKREEAHQLTDKRK